MIGIAIHGTTDFFFYPLTFVNWNLAIGISFLDNSKLSMQSPPSSVAFQSSPKLIKAWNDFLIYMTDIWIQKRKHHSWIKHVFTLWYHSEITSFDNSNTGQTKHMFSLFLRNHQWKSEELKNTPKIICGKCFFLILI